MAIERLFDFLQYYIDTYPNKEDALAGKVNGDWKRYSIQEYVQIVDDLAKGLVNLGVEKGDRIASISPNAPEWNFIDQAIMSVGAIHVPVYPTISASDYEYIFNHAEVKMVFLAGRELFHKVKDILPKCSTVEKVYTFTPHSDIACYKEVIELGKTNPNNVDLKSIQATITTNDIATIIYTSGTTGTMKGVMLTHQNVISNALATAPIPKMGVESSALSFLPLCHVYERMLNYMEQYNGISVYYAENMATIIDNIQELKVDMMSTVPRLLERVFDKIIAKGDALTGVKKSIFNWAMELGFQYDERGYNSPWYKLKLAIADKLVFSKWRLAFGGNMKILISGGAALQPRLGKIFWAANIPVVEGYGLTETSPVIAVNTLDPDGLMIGSVGLILDGVEVKIAEDGEIMSRGPNLMKGYYKEPELTDDVITDGWFHTGDLGEIVEGKFLKITGRKKDLFKTSMGKYVAPGHIEDIMKESSFIDNVVVVGEGQRFAGAIIIPNFDHLISHCKSENLDCTKEKTPAELIKLDEVRKLLLKEVNILNKRLGAHEHVKTIALSADTWDVESGVMTAKMSIKRMVVCERYKNEIEEMFR